MMKTLAARVAAVEQSALASRLAGAPDPLESFYLFGAGYTPPAELLRALQVLSDQNSAGGRALGLDHFHAAVELIDAFQLAESAAEELQMRNAGRWP